MGVRKFLIVAARNPGSKNKTPVPRSPRSTEFGIRMNPGYLVVRAVLEVVQEMALELEGGRSLAEDLSLQRPCLCDPGLYLF